MNSQIEEKTFKQGVDEFIGCAPEGGWSDYWAMQQDWEFYKDSLCRDGVITQKQADSWSNPCTPETFARWQKRNGLVRRGYESKKSNVQEKGNKDVYTLDLTRIDGEGNEEGLDDMQAAQTFYDEDDAIKAAKELADSYKDEDDVVQVTVMAGEQEKPNGDIVGEPFDIFTASSSDSVTTAKYREKAGYSKTDGLDYYAKGGKPESKKSEGLPFGKRFTDAAGHKIELSDWRIKEDDLGYFCGYDKGGKPIFDQDISKSVVFPFDPENYPNDEVSKEMDRLWKMGYTNTRKLQKATRVEAKKSEDYKNFTLKQLRFQLKNGWAKDLTNASDAEIQAIIDSGHEISGVSNGTYGMNGLKVTYSNPDGSIGSGVVIGRTPNLFALLSPQKPKKTGDAPKPSESKKSEGIGDRIKMGIDYNMFMRMCGSAAYLDDNEDYWDALWEYYSEMGEIEDACEFFDNLFQYTAWCDADTVYDEYLDDKFKDESKSKEECIQAAIDDGDLDAYKHDSGNYLVIS